MNFDRYIFILFSFYFHLVCSQQINSGEVTYNIKPFSIVDYNNNNNKENKMDENAVSYFKMREINRNKISNLIEYKLKFNAKKSVFFMENILEHDIILGVKSFNVGKIFTNDNEILQQLKIYGSDFIITKNKKDVNWKLKSETKKIGKYICYKAVTAKTIINTKGTFYRNITAWYCPEIAVYLGPMGYGNLPGLILELKIDKKGVYTLKKIKLNTKNSRKIKMPTVGKKVTEKEFNEIGKKVFKKRNSGM